MVLNELAGGLKHHSLITSEDQRSATASLLAVVTAGVRGHRQERGPAGDLAPTRTRSRGCAPNYVDNVKAYTQKERCGTSTPARTRSPTSG